MLTAPQNLGTGDVTTDNRAAAHTPGPWHANYPNWVPWEGAICITSDLGHDIAWTTSGALTKPADARLIAAAPAMYKALQQCLGLLCEAGNLNNYRTLSDAELGKVWVETAKAAAAVLNEAGGVPERRQGHGAAP